MPLPTVGLLWSNLLYSLAIIVVSIITVLQDKSYRRKTLHSRYIYILSLSLSYLQLFPILSALRSRSVFSLFFFRRNQSHHEFPIGMENGKEWKIFFEGKKKILQEKKKKENKMKKNDASSIRKFFLFNLFFTLFLNSTRKLYLSIKSAFQHVFESRCI